MDSYNGAPMKTSCPLSCGTESEISVIDAGGLTIFICPECLGVAFDGGFLCDPRQPLDLSRVLVPAVDWIRAEASLDPLTRVKNAKFFFRRLEREIAEANHHYYLSVIAFIVDLENLYARAGVRSGEKIFQSFVAEMFTAVRSGDNFARVESDAFGLILRNADQKKAEEIAERISIQMGKKMFRTHLGDQIQVRVITGVTEASTESAEILWKLLSTETRARRDVPAIR